MTFKEMNAAVMLLGSVVISVWVLKDTLGDASLTLPALATRLCWAIGASVIFNIVAAIVFTILISIAQGRELKDEPTDERDHVVGARAMRNAYVVASVTGLISLILWALGYDVLVGVHVLFAGLMLAGATDAASRLLYYRVG